MPYIDTKYIGDCDYCRHHRTGSCDTWCDYGECFEPNMTQIPLADVVEVRHGEWLTDAEDLAWGNSLKRKHCSECGGRPHWDNDKRKFILAKFCHHCGAKMDGK